MSYLDGTDERHVLALDDFEIDGGGRDLGDAGELLVVGCLDVAADQPLRAVTLRLDQVWHCEVLEPVVKLQQVAVAVPFVTVQSQVAVRKLVQ